MNDSHVTKVPVSAVMRQIPYILFYEREIINNVNKQKLIEIPLLQKNQEISPLTYNVLNNKDIKLEIVTDINTKNNFIESIKDSKEKNATMITLTQYNHQDKNDEEINIQIGIPVTEINLNKEEILEKEETRSNSETQDLNRINSSDDVINSISNIDNKINEDDSNISKDIILKEVGEDITLELNENDSNISSDYNFDLNLIPKFFRSRKNRKLIKLLKSMKTENFRNQFSKALNIKGDQIKNKNIENLDNNSSKQFQDTKIKSFTLKNLYGRDNIDIWDENMEEDADKFKNQINFVKRAKFFEEKQIKQKDEYDMDYDKGRVKKVKIKNLSKEKKGNLFQYIHNKKQL